MQEVWQEQMRNYVNTIEKLEEFINLSDSEREALETLTTTWGTTPYFAALMDRDNPDCPIRKQVMSDMQAELHDKELGLLRASNDAPSFYRADNLLKETDLVLEASCRACLAGDAG